MWTSLTVPDRLDAGTLAALFANEIPAIRLADFASPEECRRFAEATRRFAMRPVVGDTPVGQPAFAAQRIDHLGMTQAEYKRRGPDAYLEAARRATAEVRLVFALSFDPVQRLIERLQACIAQPVAIAHEPDGRLYFCGIVRNSNEGLALHADFAPYQARKLAVERIDAQLAWNFYAESPAEGGVTTLHDAPWQWTPRAADEIADNYPLPRTHVTGARTFEYQPKAGEAWLFNTRNPHEVSPIGSSECDRLATACFVGRMPDRSLVLWS
jgi:hypothetical protein